MKTFNYSNSVAVRADLFDTENRLTDVTPVFRFTPVTPNGEFHVYSFNFDGNWGSNTPLYGQTTDKSMIKGIRFYINYGLYGKSAADSLWFQDIVVSNESLVESNIVEQDNQNLKLYPNPCSDFITVDAYNVKKSPKVISIFDISGRLVLNSSINELPASIHCADFQKGIYCIKVQLDNQVYSRFLVKQ